MIRFLPPEIRAEFPFEPRWADVDGYVLHYVDEGPRVDAAVVLLHGNPTWSFLYRKIIPVLVAAGYRAVAPDHLGSGRSDHAATEAEYAPEEHARRLGALLDAAGVHQAVFFWQDWGGPIGMAAARERPGLLRGAVMGNTFWGEASSFHRRPFPWRALHGPVLGPLAFDRLPIFVRGAFRGMPDVVTSNPLIRLAYELPWIGGGAGATMAWPRALSLGADHPTQPFADRLWEAAGSWDVPVRFVWGVEDPVFPWAESGEALRDRLPNGKAHDPVLVPAGHFVQEFAPGEIAEALLSVAGEAGLVGHSLPEPDPDGWPQAMTTPTARPGAGVVLTDPDVSSPFQDALDRLGSTWTAPSSRSYQLVRDGARLDVLAGPGASSTEIDADLLELAAAIADLADVEWNGEAVREVYDRWALPI